MVVRCRRYEVSQSCSRVRKIDPVYKDLSPWPSWHAFSYGRGTTFHMHTFISWEEMYLKILNVTQHSNIIPHLMICQNYPVVVTLWITRFAKSITRERFCNVKKISPIFSPLKEKLLGQMQRPFFLMAKVTSKQNQAEIERLFEIYNLRLCFEILQFFASPP